jgi:23S rRNA (guanosine2251-2'-O)-methyltransferase
MIVYGRNTVLEALKSNYDVLELYLQEFIPFDEKIKEINKHASKRKVEIKRTTHKALTKLVGEDEHQGIAAKINYHDANLYDVLSNLNSNTKSKSFIYISDATYDHNIGAIIRSAECAGLAGVIVPTKINITSKIAKISTGALLHIPIIKLSIFQAIKSLHKEGYKICGIERDGNSYFNADLNQDCLFIIGGEDRSLTENIRTECDEILEIPQFGKINSLNMSVASSIVIFEHIRQILSAKQS